MVLHLIIKNFGKVESADILLNNLVVFVGNNNSGKTMVMQLIYGLRKVLENFSVPIEGARKSGYLIRCDQEWFREVELHVNRYLAENKSQIVEDIFGLPVSVGELRIGLEYSESEYFVSSVSDYEGRNGEEQKEGIRIVTRQYESGEETKSFENWILEQNSSDEAKEVLKIVWRIILADKTEESEQLFLPASRSGLQLLYRHYFAGRTDGNMAVPMKDFLCFLQLYSMDKQLDEVRKALLEFGEEHLLQGRIIQEGDETFYVDGHGDKVVPLYIASSMIHELTPFIKALSATKRIDWLYCDEVENSLHPLLQREMARWLIRMVNAGMHVVISSHSDTMASRLNNLFMLTHLISKKADYDMLTELDLMRADLLNPDVKAGVYEFRNDVQGKTIVEKLEFISHPLIGYDFQLFGQNLDRLYQEADRITR